MIRRGAAKRAKRESQGVRHPVWLGRRRSIGPASDRPSVHIRPVGLIVQFLEGVRDDSRCAGVLDSLHQLLRIGAFFHDFDFVACRDGVAVALGSAVASKDVVTKTLFTS